MPQLIWNWVINQKFLIPSLNAEIFAAGATFAAGAHQGSGEDPAGMDPIDGKTFRVL